LKRILPFFLILLAAACGHIEKEAPHLELVKTTHLPHYPSASSLAFYRDRLYVIGDDAPFLLVLDSGHRPIDSLRLFHEEVKRIPKQTKADLEASATLVLNGKPWLYAFSSFSTPARNRILRIAIGEKGQLQLISSAASSFHIPALAQLNIEGAAAVQDKLVLSNRANNTTRVNYLLVTVPARDTIRTSSTRIIPVTLPGLNKVAGISGLHYVAEKDLLLFSASTEETPNAYTDGAVGESYIGYIRAITDKLNAESLVADTLIPLSPYLGRQEPQKIESITVERVSGHTLIIHLAADNDNGESTLYKMRWRL
jgi:hypothetical protein